MTEVLNAWPVLLVFFSSAVVKGVTGLGFSTICLALLAGAYGLKESLPLVIIPSLVSNAFVMLGAGGFKKTAVRFRLLYLAVIPGTGLGLLILVNLNNAHGGALLGLLLILYSLYCFLEPRAGLPPAWEKPLSLPVGFLTGLCNGITGTQLMPVLPYLMSLGLSKDQFVQAINISFTFSSLLLFLGLTKTGFVTWLSVQISLAGLPAIFAGVYLGSMIRKRVSESLFRHLILAVLLLLGGRLILKSFF